MRRTRLAVILLVICVLLRVPQVAAEAAPFIALGAMARPMVDLRTPPGVAQDLRRASLFAGTGSGLFEPSRRRDSALAGRVPGVLSAARDWQAARLFDLIAKAEAGRAGYDAVQHGARVKPDRPPTQMTLREIYAWIDRTPGQPHAIGRYQFIPLTLRQLVRAQGLSLDTRFSPAVQDNLAQDLLTEAGFHRIKTGALDRHAFMHNLARIWAGLPTASGRSHYHGHAGNKATMSWAAFEREMARIFPG